MDGFRALAHVGPDQTRLISRRGNVYQRFTELAAAIHIEIDCEAVLDGEIVCLDKNGRPQFYDLLRRRGAPRVLRLRPVVARWRGRATAPANRAEATPALDRAGATFGHAVRRAHRGLRRR